MPAPGLLHDETDLQSPLHGYRGERSGHGDRELRGLAIAISREAGARGAVIAKRVAEQLGWQLFDHELLGYLVQNEAARDEMLADVPPGVLQWANEQHAKFLKGRDGGGDEAEWLRLMLVAGARGEAVILGRGAGALLPVASTLNVRIVAPWEQRVAYLSQSLRLPAAAAREEVAARDRVRAELHRSMSGRDDADLAQYDLVLNSGRLGEAACADLIAEALRSKQLPGDAAESSSDELGVV